MPSRKVTEVEITRQVALEGNRRERWTVQSRYLHKFEEFTEWFAENKSSLPERILRSDSNILERFIKDRIANTGERESFVWDQVIAEICGDSDTDDDDMEEVYGAESEYFARDASHWQHYAEQPLPTYNALVTESDTEPEPEPEPELGRVDGTWIPPEPISEAVVQEVVVVEPEPWVAQLVAAEPMTAQDREANFVALSNRQKQFIPEDTTIRVTPDTLGKLLEYTGNRWITAYPQMGELLGREWDIVNAVLSSRELWTHICCLIDRKCYDMGLLSTGEG